MVTIISHVGANSPWHVLSISYLKKEYLTLFLDPLPPLFQEKRRALRPSGGLYINSIEKLAILRDGAIMQARVLHLLLLKEGPTEDVGRVRKK